MESLDKNKCSQLSRQDITKICNTYHHAVSMNQVIIARLQPMYCRAPACRKRLRTQAGTCTRLALSDFFLTRSTRSGWSGFILRLGTFLKQTFENLPYICHFQLAAALNFFFVCYSFSIKVASLELRNCGVLYLLAWCEYLCWSTRWVADVCTWPLGLRPSMHRSWRHTF